MVPTDVRCREPLLWCEETGQVMVIDFERATVADVSEEAAAEGDQSERSLSRS